MAESIEITDATGARMVFIPAGAFLMGTATERILQLRHEHGIRRSTLLASETPQHPVWLDAYYMDVNLTTNAQFRAFVEAEPDWSASRISRSLHNGRYLSHWQGTSFRGIRPIIPWSTSAGMRRQPTLGGRTNGFRQKLSGSVRRGEALKTWSVPGETSPRALIWLTIQRAGTEERHRSGVTRQTATVCTT